MTDRRLPLFPLNTVVFPGASLPLHVFEDRYRALVRDLLAVEDPAERLFGVIAIREGYEVGAHESRSMYRTGCVMQLTETEAYDDGQFDIMAVGRQRMRVLATDADGPYLCAEVALEPSEAGEPTPEAAEGVARTLVRFDEYRTLRADLLGDDPFIPLPRDPELLSYTLAATVTLTLRERQTLLEAPDAATRLRLLRRFMGSELRAMRALPSLPATEVARTGWNPN